jgi:hypothetical protein
MRSLKLRRLFGSVVVLDDLLMPRPRPIMSAPVQSHFFGIIILTTNLHSGIPRINDGVLCLAGIMAFARLKHCTTFGILWRHSLASPQGWMVRWTGHDIQFHFM